MFLIDLRVKIEVPVLGKETTARGSQALVPMSRVLKGPTKILQGDRFNVISEIHEGSPRSG